ncbi:MAG: hypothetical protein MMC33_006363 [Icmadophila ericetorum]|nr:hypothetical protein [Icmadophila ericetorum]
MALSISIQEVRSTLERHYTTVPGYFLQDDSDTVAETFDFTQYSFGLKNRSVQGEKTQWQNFGDEVQQLNEKSASDVQYKVLFLGRHGQGWHNVAEHMYGTESWDCYWSKLEGNGIMQWADATLTNQGIKQAELVNQFWTSMIKLEKIPTPQKYYTSPLDRCCATAKISFSGIDLPSDRPFTPIIKELLREVNGVHTCDRRSSKTCIHNTYPDYTIEEGFAENDELWEADERESNSALDARLKKLLDDIFEHDDSTFISLTSHSGSIASLLRVLGHRPFRLVTGSVIPVLVKSEKKFEPPNSGEIEPPIKPPVCNFTEGQALTPNEN